jgi:glutaredoxin
MIRILVLALTMLAAGTAGAQIYRWTDAQGKVHIGDRPPAGAKARRLTVRDNSYSAPPQAAPASAAAAAAAPPAGPVTMYSTSWCGYCAQARSYFARKGIAYQEHDVEKSAEANAQFKRLGGRGVPLILYGDQRMSGFSEGSFEALVARASR